MKIGILTLPLHFNYGGILQAYALQTILENMGHEVVVFNKKYSESSKSRIKRFFGVNRYKKDIHNFIIKKINNRWIEDFSNLNNDDYDAIVVGSDQVWRCEYFSVLSNNFSNAFLSFTKNWKIKRLSYAASFGVDNWSEDKDSTNEIRALLNDFDAVSVREQSGVEICKEIFGINSLLVVDPTMLIPISKYMTFVKKTRERGILKYILDITDSKLEFINKVKKQLNLDVFSNNPVSRNTLRDYSVENWISGFTNASIVITDSFHACVFSILFHKPFYVLANSSRGISRINTLLSTFGLTHLLIDESDIENVSIPNIEWDAVDKVLIEKREQGINFLDKILS